jgi:hypothetical protein
MRIRSRTCCCSSACHFHQPLEYLLGGQWLQFKLEFGHGHFPRVVALVDGAFGTNHRDKLSYARLHNIVRLVDIVRLRTISTYSRCEIRPQAFDSLQIFRSDATSPPFASIASTSTVGPGE